LNIKSIIAKDLNELLKGSFISLLFKIVGIGIGYLFFIMISRWYGAYYMGIFSISWTILMIGSVVAKWGMDTAIVRFISESKTQKSISLFKSFINKGIIIVVAFSILMCILMLIFSSFIKDLFFSENIEFQLILLISLSIIPLSLLGFTAELFRGLKKIIQYSIFQSGTIYIFVIVISAIIYYFFSKDFFLIESLLATLCILSLLSLLLFRNAFKKELTVLNNTTELQKTSYYQILLVSTPMLLTNSLYLIMNWTDILMLGYFENEAQTGIYNAAVKTAALGSVAISAINSIAAPKFAEIYLKEGKNGLGKLVRQSTMLSLLLSLPVFAMIFIFPDFLLGFFGNEFNEAKTSLIILTIGHFINTFSGSTLYLLNMTGKEKAGRNILGFGALLNIILNILLIPVYGITGAAIATASSTILWNSIAVIYIFRNYGFATYPSLKFFKNA